MHRFRLKNEPERLIFPALHLGERPRRIRQVVAPIGPLEKVSRGGPKIASDALLPAGASPPTKEELGDQPNEEENNTQ